MIVVLDAEGFEQINPEEEIIVLWWSSWCVLSLNTIDRLKPIDQKVYTINVDENKDLSDIYCVQFLPTIMWIKNKEILKKHVGVATETTICDVKEMV